MKSVASEVNQSKIKPSTRNSHLHEADCQQEEEKGVWRNGYSRSGKSYTQFYELAEGAVDEALPNHKLHFYKILK